MCEYVTIPQCFRPSYKNLKEKWWQMKKYYVHKKNWCLMPQPHLCIWTRQRKRMGPIYWSLIFFPAQCRVFWKFVDSYKKEIFLHEMMCKNLHGIVIIGWKPMCSIIYWFDDFLKKNSILCNPYSFPYWKSDFVSISKNSILSLLKRILFLTEKLLFQKHTKF